MMGLILSLSSQPSFGDQDYFATRLPLWFGDAAWLKQWAPVIAFIDDYGSSFGHVVEYGLLGAAFAFGWRREGLARRRAYLLAWLCTLFFGIIDETYQGTFVPNRHASWEDLVKDGVGAGVALLLLWVWGRKR
jgi:VanZ family protein